MACRWVWRGQWARGKGQQRPGAGRPSWPPTFLLVALITKYFSSKGISPQFFCKKYKFSKTCNDHFPFCDCISNCTLDIDNWNNITAGEKWFSPVVEPVQPKNGDKRCNLKPFSLQTESLLLFGHIVLFWSQNLALTFILTIWLVFILE